MEDKIFASQIANSPAMQWAIETFGQHEFQAVMEVDAAHLLFAGFSAVEMDKTLPDDITAEDILKTDGLNRCPTCKAKFYLKDAKLAPTEFHEHFITLVEEKLPARVRPLYRIMCLHAPICR